MIYFPEQVNAHCEVFFRCTETVNPDGSGSMVDSIRGATYTPSSAGVGSTLVNSSTPANSLFPTITAAVQLTAGTWPNFKQRSVVTFACGVIVDAASPIRTPIGKGDSPLGFPTTGGLISLSLGGAPHIVINDIDSTLVSYSAPLDGINQVQWQIPPIGTVVGVVLEYEPAGQANPRVLGKLIDTSGNIFPATLPPEWVEADEAYVSYVDSIIEASPPTITFGTGDVNPGLNNYTRFGGLGFYGFAAFSFDNGLPSREVLDAAYLEMMRDWSSDSKKLPEKFSYSTPPS